jgi:ribonuclease G
MAGGEAVKKTILVNGGIGETRVALLEDGTLAELLIDRAEQGAARALAEGTRVLGRVTGVVKGLDAAFVDIGLPKGAFLPADEAQVLAKEPPAPIASCVHEGEAVIVQVTREPAGDKGARVTANVTMPGHFLVFMPRQERVAISRNIQEAEERDRLQAIVAAVKPEKGGFIVRTAAQGADEAAIRSEAERLVSEWRATEAAARTATPPRVLGEAEDRLLAFFERADLADPDRIVVDDDQAMKRLRKLLLRTHPGLIDRVERHRDERALFDAFGIEGEIEMLAARRVEIGHGAWLTIERTEAATIIDVNAGGAARGGDEDTALNVNLAAVRAAARHIRLRNIAGLIVIDLIAMETDKAREAVRAAMVGALRGDAQPHRIGSITPFGLLEVTRRRGRDTLDAILYDPLPTERMPSAETVAYEILRRAVAEARAHPGRAVTVAAAAEVASWLEDHRAGFADELRRRMAGGLTVTARENWPRTRFDVRAD